MRYTSKTNMRTIVQKSINYYMSIYTATRTHLKYIVVLVKLPFFYFSDLCSNSYRWQHNWACNYITQRLYSYISVLHNICLTLLCSHSLLVPSWSCLWLAMKQLEHGILNNYTKWQNYKFCTIILTTIMLLHAVQSYMQSMSLIW